MAEEGSSSPSKDGHTTPESNSTLSPDDAFLASLGYKQEFKRQFSKMELFGVSFSIIGVLPSIACVFISTFLLRETYDKKHRSVLVYALPNGGATALVWGVCARVSVFIDV